MSDVTEHITISPKSDDTSMPIVMYEITFLNSSRFASSAPGARLPACCRSCNFRSETSPFLVGLRFKESEIEVNLNHSQITSYSFSFPGKCNFHSESVWKLLKLRGNYFKKKIENNKHATQLRKPIILSSVKSIILFLSLKVPSLFLLIS